MKAACIFEHGELDKIKVSEIDTPKIGPNDILIRTKYGALNHLDIFVVKGWPGLNLHMPHVLGSDGAGFVEEVGSEVSTCQVGDHVTVNPGISCGKCYQCLSGRQNFCNEFSIIGENQNGTFAEFFKIPEVNVLKLPPEFPIKDAAAAPLTFLTAWRMLATQGQIKHGNYVFIHGAGGGVASAAIQIAKIFDATVITSTSSEEKQIKAESLGADHVINYVENQDYSKYVYRELTDKKGVDIVIDSVGNATFPTSIRLLKPGGRLITCGVTSGPKTDLDIRHIFWKQLEIKGSTMSNQSEFRDVMELVIKKKISPVVDKVFPLDQVNEAEEYLKNANQFGKVLIEIAE